MSDENDINSMRVNIWCRIFDQEINEMKQEGVSSVL